MDRAALLYEIASAQDGHFTASQAADAGYSNPLIAHHVRAGRFLRVHRGIYRLAQYPAAAREDLVVAWLWSEHAGVVSHDSALALRELSDAMPSKIHLTVPAAWRTRRLRAPPGVVLHCADVAPEERGWHGAVPVTTIARTLRDCALAGLAPDLLRTATQQALRRGLVLRADVSAVDVALHPFGGLGV